MHFPLPIRESELHDVCEICERIANCISMPSIEMSQSDIEKMRKEITQSASATEHTKVSTD